MDRPGLGHDMAEPACDTTEKWATTQCGRATIRPGARDTTCSAYGWELGRDTKIVLWLRGGRTRVAIQCNHGLRYDAKCPATRRRGAATCAAARDTARAHGLGAGCVAIQPASRPARAATWLARLATRSATSHDTTRHRSTTRPAWSSARGLCVQAGSGCVPGAPNPVLTQCTVPSYCFGTLFMSTFHEV